VVKSTTERFSGVDGRNFTKLEVNLVELSLQDKFVLEFAAKLPRFCIKDRPADRRVTSESGLKWVVLPLK